jgi:2-methylisocitrate lyase-like PEP mutase family enzyme
VRAAVEARQDPDFVIIARTDAAAVHGLDEAIARGRAFAEAGADALFVEAPTSEDDIARVATELRGVAPLLFNWAEGGRTPPLPLDRIAELGFSLVIFPIGTVLAATAGIRSLLTTLQRDGTPAAALPELPGFGEFTDLIGLPEMQRLEHRFAGG